MDEISGNRKIPLKDRSTIVGILLISIMGSLGIFYATKWGPWAYSDSTEYIVSARNLLAGNGLGIPAPSGSLMPLTLHPPFYSLVLSALGLIGFDLIEAARWLNIFLFGATIFLTGTFTYTHFHSSWLALSLSATLLTLPTLVDVSSGAMSELLYIFTTILGICLLINYLGLRKSYLLILSALSIGLACLSRYPGVVVIVTGIIGLLLADRISWKQRIKDIIKFSLISTIPNIIWLIWIYYQTRTLGAREYQFTPHIWSATLNLRKKLMEFFWSWLPFQKFLPPYSYNLSRNIVIFLVIFILILVCLIAYRKIRFRNSAHSSTREFTFTLLWLIFIIGNLILLAATFIFTNPQPDLNLRTLLPIQFGLAFAIMALFSSVINEFRLPHTVGWVCAAVVLIFTLSYAHTSWNIINQYHKNGAGYTSVNWHNSLTLQAVRGLPLDIPIISNEAAAVLLLLNRPAYDFCTLPCDQSGQFHYGDDPLDSVQLTFRENRVALVLFYPYCGIQDQTWYSNTMAQLKLLTQNLTGYFSSCDGAIYFYPSSGQY